MEYFSVDKFRAYEFKTENDDEKRIYVRHASKYMFIFDDDYKIILIDFQMSKYRDIQTPRFINELTTMFTHIIKLLKSKYPMPKAIVLSDSHLNIIQLLFPFMFGEYIDRIDTHFKLTLNKDATLNIIHLGDYTISTISKIYKEYMPKIKPYCIITMKLVGQLLKSGTFLVGNHDWFIAQKLPLSHHHVERIGSKNYLFIHGPPMSDDVPENKYQFKDKMFFRINRHQNHAWNKAKVDNLFKKMLDKTMTKIDIIVCGHEQTLSLLDLPDDVDELLAQYSLPKTNFVCLDCPSSTRGYFAFESSEIDHPYLSKDIVRPNDDG